MTNNPGDLLYVKRIIDDINDSLAKREAINADIRPMANTFYRGDGGATTVSPLPADSAEEKLAEAKASQNQLDEETAAKIAAEEAGPVPTNEALEDVALNQVTGTRTGPYDPNPEIPASTEELRKQVMADLDESIGPETPAEGLDPVRARVRDYVAKKRGLQGPTLEDLQAAQGRAGTKRFLANLNRATKDYLSGVSGAEQGTGLAEGLEAEAKAEIQDVADQQALLDKQSAEERAKAEEGRSATEFENQERLKDPSSPESIAARQVVEQTTGEKVPTDLSYSELQEMYKYYNLKEQVESRLAASKLNYQLKEQQQTERLTQRQQEENRRFGKQINDEAQRLGRGDAVIKKAREQMETFSELEPLLEATEQGNQAAIAALGTRMARAMGEVGVLTDQDVVRYLGNTSWARQVSSWLKKGAAGQLPEGQLEDLKAMVSMMEDIYNKKIGGQMDQAAKVLMKRYPTYVNGTSGEREEMTLDKARGLVGHPSYLEDPEIRESQLRQIREEFGIKQSELKTPEGKVKVISPDGRPGFIPIEQLEKALQQGYKEAK